MATGTRMTKLRTWGYNETLLMLSVGLHSCESMCKLGSLCQCQVNRTNDRCT
jgi:hypothetical protein